MTVCKCKICGEELLHHLLKKHMKNQHNCNLTKNQYEYIKETYYRCREAVDLAVCNLATVLVLEGKLN